MTHEEKITWMAVWASKNHCQLELQGECGFWHECVGIISSNTYPDYEENVWTPIDAYHKHPCVAVLGRGEVAESQLYDWIKWFDDNNYTVKISEADTSEYQDMGIIGVLMGKNKHIRMEKSEC